MNAKRISQGLFVSILLSQSTTPSTHAEVLAFPAEPLATPPLLRDAYREDTPQCVFNGAVCLAAWNVSAPATGERATGFRLLDVQGIPLAGNNFQVLGYAAEGGIVRFGDGWLAARTRRTPRASELGGSLLYMDTQPEFQVITAAGLVQGAVPFGPSYTTELPSTGVAGHTLLESDGQWAFAAWRETLLNNTSTEGCWMQSGSLPQASFTVAPVGTPVASSFDGSHAFVATALNGKLVGYWLAAGASVPSRVDFAEDIALLASSQIRCEAMAGGACIAWVGGNTPSSINCVWVGKNGATSGVQALGSATLSNRALDLIPQSDGSVRAVWLENSATWKTAAISKAGSHELAFVPSPVGEPVPYFTALQRFTAGIGPAGNVTLSTSSGTGTLAFVSSQWGLPAYPLGEPQVISGRLSNTNTLGASVCALPDGYAVVWLEDRGEGLSLYLDRLDASAHRIWPAPVLVVGSSDAKTPAVTFGADAIAVGWIEPAGLWLQKVSLAGELLNQPLLFDSHGLNEFRGLRLAFAAGNYLGVWREGVRGAYRWITPDLQFPDIVRFMRPAVENAPAVSSSGNAALLLGRSQGNTVIHASILAPQTLEVISLPPLQADGVEAVNAPAAAWNAAANQWLAAWFSQSASSTTWRLDVRLISANGELPAAAGATSMATEIPVSQDRQRLAIAPSGQGWLLTYAPETTDTRMVLFTAASGFRTPQSLSAADAAIPESLLLAQGPNGGVLLVGQREPARATMQLLYPQETVPTLAVLRQPNGLTAVTWAATTHFPASPATLEVSDTLRTWTCPEWPVSQQSGAAQAPVLNQPQRQFYRLRALR